VKKLFYALFCASKIVLSLESVEKIQPKPLSRRGPGSEQKFVLPVFIKNVI
jgi:hypothetical protein